MSGETLHSAARGYGWLDLRGSLSRGSFHKKQLHWEGAQNLNLVMREGPDALAEDFAAGPAVFALDLPPDRYDVWILTGDWGLLEHIPHEPYRIRVEQSEIRIPGPTSEQFFAGFESPGPDDTLDDAPAYDRYVAPRFRWERVTTPVDDGQLTVQLLASERPRSILGKLGRYPFSDIRLGPKRRFAGALNAMIVTRSDPRSELRIQRLESQRRDHFRARHPRKQNPVAAADASAPLTADLARGYSLFAVTTEETILPATSRPHEPLGFSLRATPGEHVPFSFAVRPHRALGVARARASALSSRSGDRIPASSLAIGAIRYVARRTPDRSGWRPRPSLVMPGESHALRPHETKQFWLTLQVPADTPAGHYAGSVELQAGGESALVPLELEVLPFSLTRPVHLAAGLTYFVPIAHAYYHEQRFWDRIREDFADMRRHNMTTVQLTGMGIENYDGLDRLFQLYREAGFERPIYLLEAYTAIDYIAATRGHELGTPAFFDAYSELFARLLAQARRRSWPPLIINFGDEFTNTQREEFGAELAERLREIPALVTAADANGYKEVRLLAPHVSILAFNQGWAGPTGVNGDRKLLNAETVALIRDAGARPWLVNVARDRFSSGLYFWKMARLGVEGKLEWIYRDYHADPHNPFDSSLKPSSSLALAGADKSTLPTLRYERMRQGLDDLAYLHTLEVLVAAAAPGPPRAEARALIDRLDAMIDDDYQTYRSPAKNPWTAKRLLQLRGELIDAILPLCCGAASSGPGPG